MFESIVLTIGQISLIGLVALAASMLVSRMVIRIFSIKRFITRILWVVFYIIVGCCSIYWFVWKFLG